MDEQNNGIDILQIKAKLMKEVMINEINKIRTEDAVEFSTVWIKEPDSDTFEKSVFIEIHKGGLINDKK